VEHLKRIDAVWRCNTRAPYVTTTQHRPSCDCFSGAPVGYLFYNAVLSPDNWAYEGGKASNWNDTGHHPALAPVAGAGLPFLAVGFGVYWVIGAKLMAV
jgi:hypothetical protein